MPITRPNQADRTVRSTYKIQQTATGLIFERPAPDAQDLVNSGAFTYVAPATESILERCIAVKGPEIGPTLVRAVELQQIALP